MLQGWTVLAAAADSGCLGLVPVLVSGGADLAVADNYGWTPLHKAAEKDQLAALVDIIREGADLNAVSKRVQCPKASLNWLETSKPTNP